MLSERRWHWVALHLALLGAVSQLILGAAQFFGCAFLATLVAAGALRGPWYQLSAICLAVGVLVDGRGMPWSHGSLIGAHLALNVAGWPGGAIVGTLHTFFPSLTGTQLRFGHLQRPTLLLWFLGVAALALGAALLSSPLVVVALSQLTAASALLVGNLVASLRARTIALTLPARLIALAQLFLPAGLTPALVAALTEGAYGPLGAAIRPTLAVMLLVGWVGLTVAGSLLHLLAGLARPRHFTITMPAPRPAHGLPARRASAP